MKLTKGGLFLHKPRQLQEHEQLRLISDTHIGANCNDYDLLEEELEIGDRILLNGDIFDFMLPADKRFKVTDLHPRLRESQDIINKALDWGYEIFKPHAHKIDMIGGGNHDERTVDGSNVDVVLLLVDKLNAYLHMNGYSHQVLYGGYQGLLDYKKIKIYYHHGVGKGGSIRASVDDLNQFMQKIDGVDVIWLGHRHSKLNVHVTKLSYSPKGKMISRDIRLVRTGAYLNVYDIQEQDSLAVSGRVSNYAADKGVLAHGKGGALLHFNDQKRLMVTQ